MPKKRFIKRRLRRRFKRRMGGSPFSSDPVSKRKHVSLWRKPGVGIPDTFDVKLKFTELISATQASGAYAEAIYRLNGPYDPRYAAGGNYPLWYASLSAIYQRQVCVGSYIKLKCIAAAGGSALANSVRVVLYPHLTAAGVTAFDDAAAQRGAKMLVTSLYPNDKDTLASKCSTHSIFGVPKAVVLDDYGTFSSASLAVPSQQAFWIIGTQNVGTETIALSIQVSVVYYVRFSGYKPTDMVDSTND